MANPQMGTAELSGAVFGGSAGYTLHVMWPLASIFAGRMPRKVAGSTGKSYVGWIERIRRVVMRGLPLASVDGCRRRAGCRQRRLRLGRRDRAVAGRGRRPPRRGRERAGGHRRAGDLRGHHADLPRPPAVRVERRGSGSPGLPVPERRQHDGRRRRPGGERGQSPDGAAGAVHHPRRAPRAPIPTPTTWRRSGRSIASCPRRAMVRRRTAPSGQQARGRGQGGSSPGCPSSWRSRRRSGWSRRCPTT